MGTPFGITSEVSKLLSEKESSSSNKVNALFTYYLILFGITTVLFAIIFFVFRNEILELLIGTNEYKFVYIMLLAASPFVVVYSIIEAFLRGHGEINAIVKISIISNIISVVFLTLAIYFFSITGVALYLFVFGIMPFLVYFIVMKSKKSFHIDLNLLKNISKQDRSKILKIGSVSLFSSLLFQFVIISLRKFIIANFGMDDNGIYQSIFGLSSNYFVLIYIFLVNYTLPKFASMVNNEDIIRELNDNLRFLFFLLVPMIVMVFSYRDILIYLFYSKAFLKGSDYLLFQLIGDIFRIMAALFGLWLIPKMRVKKIMLIDLTFSLSLFLLPYLLIKIVGVNLIIIPLSYMIAFFIHFVLFFSVTVSELKFKFGVKQIKTISVSLIILAINFFLSVYLKQYGYFTSILLISIWVYLVTDINERKSVLVLVGNKFNKILRK